MSTVPYHTHTFTIPTATPAEVAAGTRDDVAITPASQGPLAGMQTTVYDPQGIHGDAFARANQTGTQLAATISNFSAAVLAYLNGTAKATPVNADRVWQGDSTTSFSPVYSTWTQVKAFLFASPALTGTPTSTTAAVDTNTTQIATTAMVLAQAAAATPLGNASTAVVGTSTRFARADHVHPGREVLTANRTYYVRSDGSDSNTGLVNSSGGAFLTIQKAIDTCAMLDIGAFSVTVQVVDATYTTPVVVTGPWVGSGTVTVQGNSGTPANVLISITSGIAFTVQSGARLVVKDMKITTTGGGTYCLYANGNGVINFSNIDCGAAGNSHMRASDGGLITCDGNYSITGAASFHWRAVGTGVIRCASKTVTLTGTPAFTTFASAVDLGAMVLNGNTFSGSATGVRYDATLNGVIDTAGGGATYLPGGTGGTTATGGQYA